MSATAAKHVFQAIKSCWAQFPALASIHGPYREEAPPDPQTPYAVFRSEGNASYKWTCRSEVWEHRFSLTVHHANQEVVDTSIVLIGTIFDTVLKPPKKLVLSDGTGEFFKLRRMRESYDQDDKRSARGTIEYEIHRRVDRTDI